MKPRVGFIGLGIMGSPMAGNMLKAGYDLTVYNRTAEKTLSLREAGARVAASPKETADAANVIILMLTGPEAIDAILEGPEGLWAGLGPGTTVINMGTVSPVYARRLHERLQTRSLVLIDAPVSGSKKPAEEANLVILAGGPEDRVRELEPLFLTMGKKVVYCGEAGQGSNMKLVVNLLLGVMMAGFGEAINFGRKCGLSLDALFEAILSGPLACGLFNLKTEMFRTNTFPPQFPFRHMTKDLRFLLQAGDEKGAATPLGYTLFQLYRQGMGLGLGDLDFAAIKKVLETLSDR